MNALETIYRYHERTKHRIDRYAASLGYMDWTTQPDPFRAYHGCESIELPLTLEHPTPPYHLLFEAEALPVAPLHVKSLSQLLQFALGIAVWKVAGGSRWALRANASSGNLHPTEAYLILPPVHGISETDGLYHYTPKNHALERLESFTCNALWEQTPEGSFYILLSSVLWREAWKYGERAWRYTQLDAGHALQALHVSVRMLGWHLHVCDALDSSVLDTLGGFEQHARFTPYEYESADLLVRVSPVSESSTPDLAPLLSQLSHPFESIANRLSPNHHHWDIFEQIVPAACGSMVLSPLPANAPKRPSRASGDVVMKRRSAQMMDKNRSEISKEAFLQLLESVRSDAAQVHLMLFVHNVISLEPGLYCYVRASSALETLKNACHPDFAWEAVAPSLYRLQSGNFRPQAKAISCTQDIAADGAFSLGMLCHFRPQLERHGAAQYRALYIECGAIGQQLYLEATSMDLNATGIGCFLDDEMHRLLGLQDDTFQSLYHFTIGRAIVDMRIQNDPPYSR